MTPEQLRLFQTFTPGIIQHITNEWGSANLFIKRLDLIDSWATGNKYYKLKYNLAYALSHGVKGIVSKGGMFSNHLYALSEACMILGIDCTCVIRSHQPDEANPTIQKLRKDNCRLIFISPTEYSSFDHSQAEELFPGSLFVPEGGADENGIRGAAELMEECLQVNSDYLIVSGGSMCTAAGLLAAAPESMHIIIVPAWKGCTNSYVENLLDQFHISPLCSWSLWNEYHFGGFGKYNATLASFMYSFTESTGVLLDPVYTGKMMFAVKEKIGSGYFNKTDRILALHSGGLQGLDGAYYQDPVTWSPYISAFVPVKNH